MAITPYLAMTAAEMRDFSALPEKIAWMACHFSPYSTGVSNIPKELPEGSLLVLNDITPIHRHDPERIRQQLEACISVNKCSGLLLDFQRLDCEETAALAKYLVEALPCPVAVSQWYGKDLDCPVFLSPVPCHIPLQEHIAAWKGREIWLEIGLERDVLALTENGCSISSPTVGDMPEDSQKDMQLHCHYIIEITDDRAVFSLWRTKIDLDELLEEAEQLGIHQAVGLWQELN